MVKGSQGPPLKTFEAQGQLPSLPVPKLEASLQEYLRTIRPYLSQAEFANTKRIVEEFGKPGGEGEKLQRLLDEKAKSVSRTRGEKGTLTDADHPDGSNYPNCTWLENWWETYAYLSDRTSLAVNINCFQTHFRAKPCSNNVLRAAWSIKGCLDGRRLLLDDQVVPPERAGKAIFCSAQYHRIYATTRTPGKDCDHLYTYTKSKHICIERRGHWYTIDGVEDLSIAELEVQIKGILSDADKRGRGPGIAAFTGTDRTRWAQNREDLKKVSAGNASSLELIESAILHFVLSEEKPATPDEVHAQGQHGNGEQIWFDKSQTNLIFDNGAITSNLEHSSADAVVPARMYAYMDEFVQVNAPEVGFAKGDYWREGISKIPVTRYDGGPKTVRTSLKTPQRLDFELTPSLQQALQEAKAEVANLMDDNIVTCLEFLDFGAKTIAQKCKGISSDSFVQMSLALAYMRDQGELGLAYETATLRSFFHGRTECIRVQSMALNEFLQKFDDKSVPRQEIANLVREAGNSHRNYLRRCMAGQGIDRHLMGLRILAMEQGMAMPSIFTDKGYTCTTTYTLSTSQMPWEIEDWPGFGAYDPRAYAVCYRFTGSNHIVATVASRKHSGGNKDARRFSEVIKQALGDIMAVLSENPPPTSASKL